MLTLLSKKEKVLVVTIFTEFGNEPITLSARKYVFSSGYCVLRNFSDRRREEDVRAMKNLGAEYMHLGFIDAVFRKKHECKSLDNLLSFLGTGSRFLYRSVGVVLSGRLSQEDRYLPELIRAKLQMFLEPDDALYFPLAVGNHVDHLILRDSALNFSQKKFLWLDQPYSSWPLSSAQIRSLERNYRQAFSIPRSERKHEIVSCYASQLPCLFKGDVIFREEVYYCPIE
jgi:hypothetical protein